MSSDSCVHDEVNIQDKLNQCLDLIKEYLCSQSLKRGNYIAIKEETQKKASLSVQLNNTSDMHESFKKLVTAMKNSLPSIENVRNSNEESGNMYLKIDVSLESSSDTSADDSNSSFSNFISAFNEHFQDQSSIKYKRYGNSNSANVTSAVTSGEESSDNDSSVFGTESEYNHQAFGYSWFSNASSDSEGETSETGEKHYETEPKQDYKFEQFNNPAESSSDEGDFGNFISSMRESLQAAVQSNLSSKKRKPHAGSLKQADSSHYATSTRMTKAKTKRSQSASGRFSLDRIEPATKENTKITNFNLVDAEAEAKHNFMAKREVYGAQLYNFFNKTVFDHKLPLNMAIKWNSNMKSTAGTTFCKKKKKSDGSYDHFCWIQLSRYVVTSFDRLRDTLLHEMCHAAVWVINKRSDNHGPLWRTWASRVNLIHPQIEVPTRCHTYELDHAYTLKCDNCDFVVKRHKMCPRLMRKVCPKCGHPSRLVDDQH